MRWVGIRKVFSTPRASMMTGPVGTDEGYSLVQKRLLAEHVGFRRSADARTPNSGASRRRARGRRHAGLGGTAAPLALADHLLARRVGLPASPAQLERRHVPRPRGRAPLDDPHPAVQGPAGDLRDVVTGLLPGRRGARVP